MKRLFVLTNMQGKKAKANPTGTPFYFDSKQQAKLYRDELNGALGHIEWRVTRGPDNLPSPKPHKRAISSLAQKWQRGNRGRI